jgi:hypothetical protein
MFGVKLIWYLRKEVGKRVSYVSNARRMTTKLNGISELLALFPLPPPLAER